MEQVCSDMTPSVEILQTANTIVNTYFNKKNLFVILTMKTDANS